MNISFLGGIRVVSLAWVWAGPWAGAVLADMGAEVIKIESNRRLDTARLMPPFSGAKLDINRSQFNFVNRGIKSCTLDLKQPRGIALFKELVKISDVVIENFPPRVMAGLGLDYAALREIKPDIIMVSLSGFGGTGPDKDNVAYASTVEAIGGLTASFGYPGGQPAMAYINPADPTGGLFGALSVCSALYYRSKTGKGQHVDVSQTEGIVSLIPEISMEYTMNHRIRPPMGNRHEIMAPHGCFRCQGEDKWVAIAISNDEEWRALCGAMGDPEWCREERFSDRFSRWQNQDSLNELIGTWTSAFTHYEVACRLQKAGVAAGPVLNIEELIDDPHIRKRRLFIEYDHPEAGKTLAYRSPWISALTEGLPPAPCLGEHNEYVFKQLLGLSDGEITSLVTDKTIY
jgi:benzylsuccinate CoA-transferase BbsF subunit